MWAENSSGLESIQKNLETSKEQWPEELVKDLDTLGKKAYDNMKAAIEEINGWTDNNTLDFMEEISTEIEKAKSNLSSLIDDYNLKPLFNLSNVNATGLDDLIDTWYSDFSWGFDLDDSDDRKDALSNIIVSWAWVGEVNTSQNNWDPWKRNGHFNTNGPDAMIDAIRRQTVSKEEGKAMTDFMNRLRNS